MTSPKATVSHQSFIFDDLPVSSVTAFYGLLEAAFERQAIPAKVSRVFLREGGWLSARRMYLRIRRGSQVADVCGAPFGAAFMVTVWIRRLPRRLLLKGILLYFLIVSLLDVVSDRLYYEVMNCSALLLLPFVVLGTLYFFVRKIPGFRFVSRAVRAVGSWGWNALSLPSLYAQDTEAAFRSLVQGVVEQAVQTLRKAQGIRRVEPFGALPPYVGN